MSVVERIKEEMKKRGISQNKLAKAAQLSQSGLSSILSGRVSPKENTLRAIAAALNMPLTDLMDENPVVSTDPWDPDEMDYADRDDETVRILARGIYKMSRDNRKKFLQFAQTFFEDDFNGKGDRK